MSIYVDEAIAAIEAFREFGARLLQKFDNGTPAGELLVETDELESRIRALIALLPTEVSLGDWKRRVHFMRVWLKKNEPTLCRGDLDYLIETDLPDAVTQMRKWAASVEHVDTELRQAVSHLLRTRDFSSVIRAAFVVLTERIRTKYGLAVGIDGPALVNEVFGSKSTLTPHLDEKQRQAIRDYLSGAYGVLRNKYAHSNPPPNLAELEATLSTVNLALRLIA